MFANCLVCKLNNNLAIVGIYRSPSFNSNDNFNSFIDSLDNVLRDLSQFNEITILGDLNIDIKPYTRDARANDYLTLYASHGLMPAHFLPTRMNNCLDHIILKTKNTATALVITSEITDHYPIFLAIETKHSSVLAKTSTRIDTVAAYDAINKIDLSEIFSIVNPDDATNTLISKIQNILKSYTKLVNIPRKIRTIKPWITPGLVRCIRHRDRLHLKARRLPNDHVLKLTYSRYRNFCNNLLRKIKKAYEKSELEKSKNNPKALWKTIKDITNIKRSARPPVELLRISSDISKSCHSVCKYFAEIGKNLALQCKTNLSVNNVGDNPTISNTATGPSNSFVILGFDEKEVETAIMNLRSDCAVGWDGISSSLLKACRQTLVPPITYIINCSISSGIVPKAFKRAIVHPIYKNGDRDSPNNYRPISVLSSLSKVFERLLNSRLIRYLNSSNILASNQYGFRSGLSTEDAVSDLVETIASKIDKKQKCLGIFLDLCKAFDTVSIPILISKLSGVGVRGTQNKLFKNYLTDRKIAVKIDSHSSIEEPISYGVPQGSVLGPSLFLIYINDLCKLRLPNSQIFSYADDTAVIVTGGTWDEVGTRAEHSLRVIVNWLTSNYLTLNIGKTLFIPFALSIRSMPPESFSIRAHVCSPDNNALCNCQAISRSANVKYLGVQIDDKLNWHKQLESLVARVRKLIYTFKLLRDCADPDLLNMVYLTLCQSVIGYCIPVWGGALKTNFLAAERAQRAVLKVMTRRPFRHPTSQLYSECNVLTVRQLYVLRCILRKHGYAPLPDPNRRYKGLVFPSTPHSSSFAAKQYYVLSSVLYNKINRSLDIVWLSKYEIKAKLDKYLKSLSYQATEDLLSICI